MQAFHGSSARIKRRRRKAPLQESGNNDASDAALPEPDDPPETGVPDDPPKPALPARNAMIIIVLSVPVTLPPSFLSLTSSIMRSNSLKISPLSVTISLYARLYDNVHMVIYIHDYS